MVPLYIPRGAAVSNERGTPVPKGHLLVEAPQVAAAHIKWPKFHDIALLSLCSHSHSTLTHALLSLTHA